MSSNSNKQLIKISNDSYIPSPTLDMDIPYVIIYEHTYMYIRKYRVYQTGNVELLETTELRFSD